MVLDILRPKNKIPAFPAKAGEQTYGFPVFEPNSEERFIFQLFQLEWIPCISKINSWNKLGVEMLIRGIG